MSEEDKRSVGCPLVRDPRMIGVVAARNDNAEDLAKGAPARALIVHLCGPTVGHPLLVLEPAAARALVRKLLTAIEDLPPEPPQPGGLRLDGGRDGD